MKNNNWKEQIIDPPNLIQIILEVMYTFCIIIYFFKLAHFNQLMSSEGLTSQINSRNSVFAAGEVLESGGMAFLVGGILWLVLVLAIFFISYKLSKLSYYSQIGKIIKMFTSLYSLLS